MSFFKRLFDKKLVPGLQLGAEKHAHPCKQRRTEEGTDSEDSDDEGEALSCPQLNSLGRRGGLDGGIISEDFSRGLRDKSMRRSRTWAGREEFAHGLTATAMARLSTSSSEYSPDDKLRAGYKKVSKSHRGRNATILSAVDRATGRPVAIKVFLKQTTVSFKLQKMQRETAVLKMTSDIPGVVKLLNVLDDQTSYYTVLEAKPGCTLIEMMAFRGGRLTEQQCAIEVAIPLLTALARLHDLGVVHRDLKPEHVLCTYGSICLLDFMESALKSEHNLNHRAGQLEYAAPEVLDKPLLTDVFHKVLYHGMSEEELPQYDEKADVWSAGVLIFEALTGQQPFMADSVEDLKQLHQGLLSQKDASGIPPFLAKHKLAPMVQQFLAAMLQMDPAARPSAQELLQHPWLQSHLDNCTSTFLLPAAPAKTSNSGSFLLGGTGKLSRLGTVATAHGEALGGDDGRRKGCEVGSDREGIDSKGAMQSMHTITAQ